MIREALAGNSAVAKLVFEANSLLRDANKQFTVNINSKGLDAIDLDEIKKELKGM